MYRPLRSAALWLTLLGGCTGVEPGLPGSDSGFRDSGGTDTTGVEPAEPEGDLADVEAALDALVAEGLPAPTDLWAVYFALLALGDETCPGTDQLDGANPLGCTASTGWTYAGMTTWEDDGWEDEFGREWVGMLTCDAEIRGPEDVIFQMGGDAGYRGRVALDGSEQVWKVEVAGSWQLVGDPGPTVPVPDWLPDGISATLTVESDESDDDDGDVLALSGGLSRGGASVYFSSLRWNIEACEGTAMEGEVQVRDTSGGWFVATWDGTCDGCGSVTWSDEVLGRVCTDWGPFVRGLEETWRQ